MRPKHKAPGALRRRSPSRRSYPKSPRRVTVGSLSYAIVANTQNFTAGIAASKSELRTLKDAFLASQSPVERYSQAIQHLEDLAQRFPSKAGALHTTIHKMKEEMHDAANEGSLWGRAMEHLHFNIDPIHLAEKAFEGVKEAAHAVGEKVESLNKLGLTADRLGIKPSELIGLAGAAKELSGVDFESFTGMMSKFSVGLGEAAAEADGPAFKAFERLGLSVEELSRMSPDKALEETAEALSKVQNSFERTFLAKEIAGKMGPQFVSFLSAGGEKILEISEHVKQLEHTDLIDRRGIHEAAVAMEDFGHTMSGVKNIAASEFAPVITDISHELADMMGAGGNVAGLQNTFHGLANATDNWFKGLVQISESPVWAWIQSHSGFQSLFETPGRGILEGPSGLHPELMHGLADKPTQAEIENSALDEGIAKTHTRYAEHYYEEQHKAEVKVERERLDTINRVMEIEGKAYEANEKRAEQIAKSQMNGAEKLRDEFTKVQELQAGGFFDLHPGAYDKVLGDLRDKAENLSDANRPEKGITNAVMSASREGIAARFGSEGTTEKQLREQQKHTKEQQDTNKLLGEVKAAILATPAMGAVP